MQLRFLGADASVRNHYRVVTGVPVIAAYPLSCVPTGLEAVSHSTCATGRGIVWQSWPTTYTIRSINNELVCRVCHRP